MVRSSLFLQQGMSQWSCLVKLFVNVKIEPAIDEPIISSQRIKNISRGLYKIWIRFIRRRNISKLATRVMLCNDIDLPLFKVKTLTKVKFKWSLSWSCKEENYLFLFHITLFLYFFRNIICTSFYRFAIRVFLHGISF